MPAVAQVRLMDQGTAHSRRSSTELGALCQAWAELVRVQPGRASPRLPRPAGRLDHEPAPVQGAGGALLGDARALVTGAQQLSGRGVLHPGGAMPGGAMPGGAMRGGAG